MPKTSTRVIPLCLECSIPLPHSRPNRALEHSGLCQKCLNIKRDREAHRCLDCNKKLRSLNGATGVVMRCGTCHKRHIAVARKVCGVCQKPVSSAATICRQCYQARRKETQTSCKDCGKLLKQQKQERCRECFLKFMQGDEFQTARAKGMAKRLQEDPTFQVSQHEEDLAELLKEEGIRFERQVPLGRFIADFVLLDHNTVLEVLGGFGLAEDRNVNSMGRKVEYYRNIGMNTDFLFSTPRLKKLWPILLRGRFESRVSDRVQEEGFTT